MADNANQGQSGAHTQPDAAAAPLDGADPAELIAGLDDVEATDVLAVAAELVAAPKRARGRPAGAGNRKNADMIAYLAAKGHRDPWLTLSLIQTADTKALGKMLCAEPLAVLAVQERAATTLMKYHHSQKPQQLDLVMPTARPLMVIEQMNVAIGNDASAFMSAGIERAEKPNEINGTVVRQSSDDPHETSSD